MNLATKHTPGAVKPAGVPKESYPGFSISDKHVDALMKEHPNLGMGHEVTGQVKLKVNHMSADDYGKRIGFDVHELNDTTHHASKAERSQKEEIAHVQEALSQSEGGGNEEAGEEY